MKQCKHNYNRINIDFLLMGLHNVNVLLLIFLHIYRIVSFIFFLLYCGRRKAIKAMRRVKTLEHLFIFICSRKVNKLIENKAQGRTQRYVSTFVTGTSARRSKRFAFHIIMTLRFPVVQGASMSVFSAPCSAKNAPQLCEKLIC